MYKERFNLLTDSSEIRASVKARLQCRVDLPSKFDFFSKAGYFHLKSRTSLEINKLQTLG